VNDAMRWAEALEAGANMLDEIGLAAASARADDDAAHVA